MADRKPIKKQNERFHIANFLDWFNKTYKSDFKVISEPEPPEAIIQSSVKNKRWIEVSNSFWNSAYAQDLTSYATPGEEHAPIGKEPFGEMDEDFAKNFTRVVKNKLEKKSYNAVKNKFGKGYLIIPIYNPFFDEETIKLMRKEWGKTVINNLNCFRSVRITYRESSKWVFKLWRI